MKMEKKQCTKCWQPLSLEFFRISKRTAQSTKCYIKCLDVCKKSRQQTKCKHGRQRSQRKDCRGGHICKYNKRRSECKDCGGSQICEHNKIKSSCPTCDPPRYLAGVVRGHVYTALKNEKEMSSTEYLRYNIETFKKQIEQQFTEGMSWENYGQWHINHRILLKYNKPLPEEVSQ